MKNSGLNIVVIILFASLSISCFERPIFLEQINLDNQSWSRKNMMNFEFYIPENKSYDLFLDVEVGEDFGWENLYVNTKWISQSGDTTEQLVNLSLADPTTGYWKGDCKNGNCLIPVAWKVDEEITKANYQLLLQQYSREELLEDIRSITLRIENSE